MSLNGFLRPVPHPNDETLRRQWVAVGLRTDPAADRMRRLERLLASVEKEVPPEDAYYPAWQEFAQQWAELTVLTCQTSLTDFPELGQRLLSARGMVDTRFLAWIEKRYAALHNQPALPPVMVHHVPRALARQLGQPGCEKVALVVLDGLAFDQWLVLREVVAGQRPHWRFYQQAVFAWIPTITCVSRQAIFAGKPPIYFPNSIPGTDKEGALGTILGGSRVKSRSGQIRQGPGRGR